MRNGSGRMMAGAFAVWSALAGCGSDEGGSTSVAAFGTEYSKLLCDGLSDCCADTGKPVDAAQCKQLFQFQQSQFQKGVDEGKYVFDGEKASECLSGMRATGFDFCGSEAGPPACAEVVSGTTPPGERCDDDDECAKPAGGDAECDYSGEDEWGKCTQEKRGAAGETCQKTCEEHGNATSCSGFGDDPTGFVSVECFRNDGLRCDSETKKCVALAAAGAACDGDDACADGLRCDFAEGKCVALTALGGDCQSNDECLGDYCDPSNKCAAPLDLGATCDRNADRDPCGADGRCSDEGKCEASGFFGDGSGLVCGFFGG